MKYAINYGNRRIIKMVLEVTYKNRNNSTIYF